MLENAARQSAYRRKMVWIAAGAVLLIGLPLILPNAYQRHVLVLAALFVPLSMGLNLILGYTGQLAFGFTAFFALGAYAGTLFSIHLAAPFWLSIPLGALFAGVVAFFLGYPCLRLRGPYFAIMTFAFAAIIELIAANWISLTNGPMGLRNPKIPSLEIPGLFTIDLKSELAFYYVALLLAVITVLWKIRLIGSRFGRAFIGIRENEDLAASVGIAPFRYKMFAWVISAVFGGIAGSGYASYMRIVDPTLFSLYYVFLAFAMVLIGGAGRIAGPILGAIAFTILPEALRVADNYRMIIFSGLLLIFIVFVPKGIAGLFGPRRAQRARRTEESRP